MLEDFTDELNRENLFFSCLNEEKKDFHPFVEDHIVFFILRGMLVIYDGEKNIKYNEGEIGFVSKNQLIKVQKTPKNNNPFMSISLVLPKEILWKYSKENNLKPKGIYTGDPNFIFSYNLHVTNFFKSMVSYFENPEIVTENLIKFKILEVIELLKEEDYMQNILFNFQGDSKLELQNYMNKNYMHNIPIE